MFLGRARVYNMYYVHVYVSNKIYMYIHPSYIHTHLLARIHTRTHLHKFAYTHTFVQVEYSLEWHCMRIFYHRKIIRRCSGTKNTANPDRINFLVVHLGSELFDYDDANNLITNRIPPTDWFLNGPKIKSLSFSDRFCCCV